MAEPASALDQESRIRGESRSGKRSRPGASGRSDDSLRRAIIDTLIYADLFEYPLTRAEILRYLIGVPETPARIAAAINSDPMLRRHLEQTGEWVHLAGRRDLVGLRCEHAAVSARMWPIARHYGAAIARLPFVRLVAVTGALAMNNAVPDDDIDLFILTQPGRLWLCRLIVVALVKLAASQGTELCPNFLLSTDHLRLSERNLFTAHEVCQMVPLAPTPWYQAFLRANRWVTNFLPNGLPSASPSGGAPLRPFPERIVTSLLSNPLFDPIERWEMRRKVRRLRARYRRQGGSVAFTPHECRGHFAAHDARILAAYQQRVTLSAQALS